MFRFCYRRPMAVSERVDAQRNHARLVAAARTLLARDGLDVSVREIARAAGVGVGTVYRHFPTRDALVDGVLEDAVEEIVAAGERALERDDPWAGFTGFVEETLELKAGNRVLKDAMETARGRERATALRKRLRPTTTELILRAQKAGALRGDFTPDDLSLVFWSMDRVIDLAPDGWRRHLGFVLDGLRA
jgi:AcrR family transcriptional regulator